MRDIGLHLRLHKTFLDLVQRAVFFNLPIFQCFFIRQETNKYISLSQEDINFFLNNFRNRFNNIYLHGSYWINLAYQVADNRVINREIELAKKLAFTHIVIHPGAAKNNHPKRKNDHIITIAKNLNKIVKTETEITIVLENSAHAGLSIGGDLHDFLLLKEHLDHPEKIAFCIDTAHAFAYGYDFTSPQGYDNFLSLIQKTITFSSLALIHLNDINKPCGSRIDKHEKIGTGLLKDILPSFINHEYLKNIPIIMELPVLSDQEELSVLEMVRSWK